LTQIYRFEVFYWSTVSRVRKANQLTSQSGIFQRCWYT